MKRIISALLVMIMLVSLFSFSASAQQVTVSKLREICTNLSNVFQKEYYSDSPKWETLEKAISDTNSYISSGQYTDEKTEIYYNSLKESYVELMHDRFDFSALYNAYAISEKLDSSAFTKESWENFSEKAKKAIEEYYTPSLYITNQLISKDKYYSFMQEKINLVAIDTIEALDNLKFVNATLPTSAMLSSMVAIFDEYILPEYFSNCPSWQNFDTALSNAKNALNLHIAPAEYANYYNNLSEKYKTLFKEAADFSPITELINNSSLLVSSQYLKTPYIKYLEKLDILKKEADDIIVFGFIKTKDGYDIKTALKERIELLSGETKALFDDLPTVTDRQILTLNIENYNNIDVPNALLDYYQKVLNSINKANAVLQDPESGHASYAEATEGLRKSASVFDAAFEAYKKNDTSFFSSDAKMTQFIIYFVIGAFLLSVIIAVFLSKHYLGKLNWRR